MKSTLENNFFERGEKKLDNIENLIPPQYRGMNSIAVEEAWIVPLYIEESRTLEQQGLKKRVIEYLKNKEAEEEEKNETKKISEQREAPDYRKIEQESEKLAREEKDKDEIKRIKEQIEIPDYKKEELKFSLFKGGVLETIKKHLKDANSAFEEVKSIQEGKRGTISDGAIDMLTLLGAIVEFVDISRIFKDEAYRKNIINDFSIAFKEDLK